MKLRYRLSAIAVSLLALASSPACLLKAGLGSPAVFDETYYGELSPMYEKLKANKGKKKIVFLGNSAVAFGVDSSLIQKELGYDGADYGVCNFGLYGAIGTKAMMDMSEDNLGQGDILVFMPEINAQAMSMYFSPLEMWRAVDGHFSYLQLLKGDIRGEMAASYPAFAAEKYSYQKEGKKPQAGAIYARASFDANCDMKNCSRPANQMSLGSDQNNPIDLASFAFDPAFASYAKDYAAALKKKGASLFCCLPPLDKLGLKDSTRAAVDAFSSRLEAAFDFDFLADPYESVLDCEWFYDSNFHLNSSGMEEYSLLLTQNLKNQFGFTTPLKTPFPAKPSLPASQVSEGDNSDLSCFSYKESGQTYVIDGLSEEGKKKSELTVPSSYNGKAISSFDAAVFQDDLSLSSLTVQTNIVLLNDSSFSGCASLKGIVLKQEDPEKIQVGLELLKGTDGVSIYVPKDSLSAYSTNYFWGHYAGMFKGF